jgi:hypothetical protein
MTNIMDSPSKSTMDQKPLTCALATVNSFLAKDHKTPLPDIG